MFVSDSNAFTNFEGLTWRGNGRAATGVDHNSKQRRESRMLHRHEAFLDFTDIALKVSPNKPDQKYTEEVLYDNLLFRNARVGISIQQQNDYLHTVTSCSFYDMDIGVHCHSGRRSSAIVTSKGVATPICCSVRPRTANPFVA